MSSEHSQFRGEARAPAAGTTSGDGLASGHTHALPLASWGKRAVAIIIDWLIGAVLLAPGLVGVSIGTTQPDGSAAGRWLMTGSVLLLAGGVVQIWQRGWRQGVTGRSWGKRLVGLRTVRVDDLQPLGGWKGLLRILMEALFSNLWIVGVMDYLWPLSDRLRQTLHDKVVGSVVLTDQGLHS